MDPRVAEMPRNRMVAKPRHPLVCPCGCGIPQMNSNGYCKHLVGFTLDRKTVELREFVGGKETFEDHRYERVGVKTREIEPADIMVEMETMTCRVYQALGDPLVTKAQHVSPDVEALMQMLQEQSKEIGILKEQMAKREEPAESELALA